MTTYLLIKIILLKKQQDIETCGPNCSLNILTNTWTSLYDYAKWTVESFHFFNPYSGITNNAAEASNAQLKRLLDFKERDIDTIVLYFYYFQNIDVNKIFKGFCNMGEFHLRKQYAYASVDPEDITLNNVIHPDSIIDLLRAKETLEKQSDTG